MRLSTFYIIHDFVASNVVNDSLSKNLNLYRHSKRLFVLFVEYQLEKTLWYSKYRLCGIIARPCC